AGPWLDVERAAGALSKGRRSQAEAQRAAQNDGGRQTHGWTPQWVRPVSRAEYSTGDTTPARDVRFQNPVSRRARKVSTLVVQHDESPLGRGVLAGAGLSIGLSDA